MTSTVHRIYIGSFILIVIATLLALVFMGSSYYGTSMEERFYQDGHDLWKPSGAIGHGLGIIGTLMILFGVFSYMARKRVKRFYRIGVLKYWLEFHIFLCVLGPFLILFHTAFKFGGIVSISFWSMVVVVASGVIGRFIYIQIPRTIQGRELSLQEIQGMKSNLGELLRDKYEVDEESYWVIMESTDSGGHSGDGNYFANMIRKYRADRRSLKMIRNILGKNHFGKSQTKELLDLVRNEIAINNRIERLVVMQKLFRYWHVAHLPFALVMLVIMIIHVGVTLAFGYKWIF